MMTTDLSTNSIGTKDWLLATAQLKIEAYSDRDEAPQAQETKLLATEDFEDVLKGASGSSDSSTLIFGT